MDNYFAPLGAKELSELDRDAAREAGNFMFCDHGSFALQSVSETFIYIYMRIASLNTIALQLLAAHQQRVQKANT